MRSRSAAHSSYCCSAMHCASCWRRASSSCSFFQAVAGPGRYLSRMLGFSMDTLDRGQESVVKGGIAGRAPCLTRLGDLPQSSGRRPHSARYPLFHAPSARKTALPRNPPGQSQRPFHIERPCWPAQSAHRWISVVSPLIVFFKKLSPVSCHSFDKASSFLLYPTYSKR